MVPPSEKIGKYRRGSARGLPGAVYRRRSFGRYLLLSCGSCVHHILIKPSVALRNHDATRSSSTSSTSFSQQHQQLVRAQNFFYDYKLHGSDWAQGMCSSSERQSPINIPPGLSPSGKLLYNFLPVSQPFQLTNTGTSLSAEMAGYGYGGITYENGWYNLMNINFHSPSEHTWNGEHFPLEVHLVHKKSDSDALVIIAVPVDGAGGSGSAGSGAGSGSAAFLEQLVQRRSAEPLLKPFVSAGIPPAGGKVPILVDEASAMDLNPFLADGKFYEYAGSLTAPPCAEVATWFVRDAPLSGADPQVSVIQEALMTMTGGTGNNRAVKDLNGRPLAMREAVKEEKPVVAPPAMPNSGEEEEKKDREHQALQWAKKALDAAKEARDYVAGLDERMRNAASARAAALASGTATAADSLAVEDTAAPAAAPVDAAVPDAVAPAVAAAGSQAAAAVAAAAEPATTAAVAATQGTATGSTDVSAVAQPVAA